MNKLKSICILVVIGMVMIIQTTQAQVFTVSSPLDGTTTGTLRWAITQANNAANPVTINFDPSLDFIPINVNMGRMWVYNSVDILGNGSAKTIIDGNQINQIFIIGGSVDVNIENMTFKNASSIGQSQYSGGGAIIHVGGNLAISECHFTGNDSGYGYGGALNQSGGALVIQNCEFYNNKSSKGGAIALTEGTTEITHTKIVSNISTDSGGGLATMGNNTLTMTNCEIQGNENYHYGGGGGGGLSLTGAQFSFVNTLITGNKGPGGGLIVTNGTGALTHCTIAGNYSDYNWGGNALLVGGGGQVDLKNNVFAKNNGVHTNEILTLPSGGLPQGIVTSTGGNFFENVDTNVTVNLSDIRGTNSGPRNPVFVVDPTNAPSTLGDFRLQSCSDAINLGLNFNLPQDAADIDGDGNIIELLPLDLLNNPRIATGISLTPTVDAGAYEFQSVQAPCFMIPIEKEGVYSFLLYPNPSNGTFYVKLTGEEQTLKQYEIYSSTGELLIQETLEEETTIVELQLELEGKHLFKAIKSDGEVVNRWFIVE